MSIKTRIRDLIMSGLVQSSMNKINVLESDMFQDEATIKSVEASPKRFEVLDEMSKLQSKNARLAGFPRTVPLVVSSINDIKKSLQTTTIKTATHRTEISMEELTELETHCRNLGIGAIGYAKVPRKFIFQGKAILYDNAIVLAMEMEKEKLEMAPSHETGVMVHKTYNKLGKISLQIADLLKAKGFGVHSGHAMMGQTLYPILAVEAGMGWYGKHGMLITPKYGPRVRLTAIYTSITNLPASTKKTHAWIEKFCSNCKRCVKKCPGNAISEESVVDANGLIKAIKTQKCFRVFAEENGCSVCMKVCPFNQVGYQKLHQIHVKRSSRIEAS